MNAAAYGEAFVLKTETPQVVDLRRHVELEGIEPSTSSMPSKVRIDQQGCRKGLQASVRVCHPRGGTTEFNFSLAPRDDVGAAVGLDDFEAGGDPLLDLVEVTDHADRASTFLKVGQGVYGHIERTRIERAEALVDE